MAAVDEVGLRRARGGSVLALRVQARQWAAFESGGSSVRKTRIFGLGLIASPFVGLFGAGICFAGIIPTLTVTVLATLVVAAITGGVYLVTRA